MSEDTVNGNGTPGGERGRTTADDLTLETKIETEDGGHARPRTGQARAGREAALPDPLPRLRGLARIHQYRRRGDALRPRQRHRHHAPAQ